MDDLADACLFLLRAYEGAEHVNVGTGEDLTIRELAEAVRDCVYPRARLVFDRSKPDGTPESFWTWAGFMPSGGGTGSPCRRESPLPTGGFWRTGSHARGTAAFLQAATA